MAPLSHILSLSHFVGLTAGPGARPIVGTPNRVLTSGDARGWCRWIQSHRKYSAHSSCGMRAAASFCT